jgi:organic radical activating enzyme
MSYTLSTLLASKLPVAEVFTEPPTTFVRLASPYDSDYCEMTVNKIASFIPPHIRHVCITGGEPLIHGDTLGILLSDLTFLGLTIDLETSGTIDPPQYWKANEHIRWSFKS